jgi:hypothetical protein
MLMFFSDAGEYGLGDHGRAGLQVFSEQHNCNAICRAFGLPPTVDTWAQSIAAGSAFEDEAQLELDVPNNEDVLDNINTTASTLTSLD